MDVRWELVGKLVEQRLACDSAGELRKTAYKAFQRDFQKAELNDEERSCFNECLRMRHTLGKGDQNGSGRCDDPSPEDRSAQEEPLNEEKPPKEPPETFIFGHETPISRLRPIIQRVGHDWSSDARDPKKAYLMACFSELAYMHITDRELGESGRYKVFPAQIYKYCLLAGRGLNIEVLSRNLADIEVRIVVVGRFVYVLYMTESFVCIAVRGSAAWSDWKMNFKFSVNDGYHRGFLNEASAALPCIRQILNDNSRSNLPVYFTGHSMGGAVASILAGLWSEQSKAMTPYVFAAPRFGRMRRVGPFPPYAHVARDDLVPHVPPRLLGFADAGLPPQVLPTSEKWLSGPSTLMLWLLPDSGSRSSHDIEGYRREAGILVGERFAKEVYVDLMSSLKERS
ncbi:hypothetical protein AU375_03338 [Methylobacterium radiotolerans]|nr:hypothetical protein AU375_03338 [Methylobacterium radiotolerans]